MSSRSVDIDKSPVTYIYRITIFISVGLSSRLQFLAVHHETAIAADGHDAPLRIEQGRHHCGWKPGTHRCHAPKRGPPAKQGLLSSLRVGHFLPGAAFSHFAAAGLAKNQVRLQNDVHGRLRISAFDSLQ